MLNSRLTKHFYVFEKFIDQVSRRLFDWIGRGIFDWFGVGPNDKPRALNHLFGITAVSFDNLLLARCLNLMQYY